MWPFIHLDELKQVNPDCVGWIHMEGSPINYPVVKQHFDRSYYLAHNFSGEESVHGRVSMDFRHGGRMGERTTVLHAHHMKDWSMFKAIVSLEDPDYLGAHTRARRRLRGVSLRDAGAIPLSDTLHRHHRRCGA